MCLSKLSSTLRARAQSQLPGKGACGHLSPLLLEALLHPLIAEEIRSHLARARSPYAILVSPLLIESGQYSMTQRILVIDVPQSLQIQRTLQRDGISEQQVQAILKAQSSREDRLNHADDVLVNDKDLAWLHGEVERLHHFYLTLRGGRS